MSEAAFDRWDWVPSAAAIRYGWMKRFEKGEPLATANRVTLANCYLVAAYAYYHRDNSLIPDFLFDAVCKELLEDYDMLGIYGVWGLDGTITRENLEAGTFLGVYPEATIRIGEHIVNMLEMGLDP